MPVPAELVAVATGSVDLTESRDRERLMDVTERLLRHPDLADADLGALAGRGDTPVDLRVALKLAESRRFVLQRQPRLRVGIPTTRPWRRCSTKKSGRQTISIG